MLDKRIVDLRLDQLEEVKAKNGEFIIIPNNKNIKILLEFVLTHYFKVTYSTIKCKKSLFQFQSYLNPDP